MITEADKAWLAGASDTKGRFTSISRKGYAKRKIRFGFDSTDESLVRAVCDLTGTKPNIPESFNREYPRLQCTIHCPSDHIHVQKARIMRAEVFGAAAFVICSDILQYMRLRQEEAQKIVELFNTSWDSSDLRSMNQNNSGAVIRLLSLGWSMPELFQDMVME